MTLALLPAHHVLNCQLDHHEDVVLGLRLDVGVELLDLQAHPAGYLLDKRRLALQAGAGNSNELAEALDDGSGTG